MAYATKLQAEAEQEIWNHPEALKWLAARGITEEAVRTYRLGYLVGKTARRAGIVPVPPLASPQKSRTGKP